MSQKLIKHLRHFRNIASSHSNTILPFKPGFQGAFGGWGAIVGSFFDNYHIRCLKERTLRALTSQFFGLENNTMRRHDLDWLRTFALGLLISLPCGRGVSALGQRHFLHPKRPDPGGSVAPHGHAKCVAHPPSFCGVRHGRLLCHGTPDLETVTKRTRFTDLRPVYFWALLYLPD